MKYGMGHALAREAPSSILLINNIDFRTNDNGKQTKIFYGGVPNFYYFAVIHNS